MANLKHVRTNDLATQAGEIRKRGLGVALGVAATVFLIALGAGATGVPSLVAGLFLGGATYAAFDGSRRVRALDAGFGGENGVIGALSKLPDDYIVRPQVRIPNPRSRTGETEIDLLVVGRTRLFVIEVKANRGEVVMSNHDKEWPVRSPGGRKYGMRNPIRQATYQMLTLKERLQEAGVRVPRLERVVVMTGTPLKIYPQEPLQVPVYCGTRDLEALVQRLDAKPGGRALGEERAQSLDALITKMEAEAAAARIARQTTPDQGGDLKVQAGRQQGA